MPQFPQEYSIEMVGTYEDQRLKEAHKLVVNLVEMGNKLEFRKASKADGYGPKGENIIPLLICNHVISIIIPTITYDD